MDFSFYYFKQAMTKEQILGWIHFSQQEYRYDLTAVY